MEPTVEPGALIQGKKRGRGTGLTISTDTRALIARQINEEKKAANAVARELGLPQPSVRQIAGAARSDARFVGSRQRPNVDKGWMTDLTMPPCPFPSDQHPNLRGKRLTVEEKYYLTCLIKIQRVPRAHVAEQYGVNEKTLFRLTQRVLAGKPLDPVGGLLPALDNQSDEALRVYAALEGEARPTRDEMKELIFAEAVKTKERRAGPLQEAPQGGLPLTDNDNPGGKKAGTKKKLPMTRKTYAKYLALYGF